MKYQITKWILTCTFLALSSLSFADNSVPTLLGVPFGQICIVKGEFVTKPNTYYAQNISKSEYFLKIFEIDKVKLPEPLIVEPVYKNIKIEQNKIYNLKAYENIESDGEPVDWSYEDQQFNYTIRHKIVIKDL